MKPRRSLLVRLGLVLALMLMSFTSAAYAKEAEEKLPPYDVPGLTHKRVWVPWVFAFLFAGGCVATALKNPHRAVSERG